MRLILLGIILVFLGCSPVVYTSHLEGDCVDRAVAIKQDLQERGYEAKIVLGIRKQGEKEGGHAWVKYRKPGEDWKRIENY